MPTDSSAFPGSEPGFRAEALARLFEAVHEGIYSGLVGRTRTVTLAANPHLKLMLGYAPETPEADVRPFDPTRFDDPQAGDGFFKRLVSDGVVTDYLLRAAARRRHDRSGSRSRRTPSRTGPTTRVRIEALVRDVSERKKLDDQSRDLYQQLLQAEKMAALGQTDLRRRARAEQPARHHPDLGRAPGRRARSTTARGAAST